MENTEEKAAELNGGANELFAIIRAMAARAADARADHAVTELRLKNLRKQNADLLNQLAALQKELAALKPAPMGEGKSDAP